MLRIGTLTVAAVNAEKEASELFAPGLLRCFTFYSTRLDKPEVSCAE